MLDGEIPDSLYELSNLKVLYLNKNEPTGFSGTISTLIGNLTKLSQLALSDNPLLTGTLPSELGLCTNLGKILWYVCMSIWVSLWNSLVLISILSLQNTCIYQILEYLAQFLKKVSKSFSYALLHYFLQSWQMISLRSPYKVCNLTNEKLNSDIRYEFFKADCSWMTTAQNMTTHPFLECDCCNTCCDHSTQDCTLLWPSK